MHLLRRRFGSSIVTWTAVIAVVLSCFWPWAQARALTETSRATSSEQIAEGVTLDTTILQTTDGPVKVFITKVDLSNPYVKIDTMVGKNDIITRNQTVQNMAAEKGAVAALNGDFFQMAQNAPIGLTVQSGQLVTSPAQRTDMYGFGLTKDNRPLFSVFNFYGTVTAPAGAKFQLFGINKPNYLAYLPNDKNQNTDANRLNMYTPRWGALSRGPLAGLTGVVEMVVENDLVREIRLDKPAVAIPANGYVLAGQGTAGTYLTTNFKAGDQVQIEYMVSPETGNLQSAVGGQALIVDQGKRHWFTQSTPGKRARSAVGASQDGRTLYLVAVEGGDSGKGMTTEELADFMVSIGVWTAVNLDGGGSTTMVARHLGDQGVSLLNDLPTTSQRSIPTAIGVFSTAPNGELAGFKITGPRYVLIGTEKAYTAKGYDVHYNPYTVKPEDISWSISPARGTFTGGTLKAVEAGDATVKASYNGIASEYPVKVIGSSDISKIEVTPVSMALNPGDSVSLGVKVTTRQGAVFNLQPNEYDVQLTGDVGTYAAGKFTAADHMALGELTVKFDSTVVTKKVSVGGIEKSVYDFDTTKELSYRDYPAGEVPGSFRRAVSGEPAFRGHSAGRLEYDFTKTTKTRAAYGSFAGGLPLEGQLLGLGLWVLGDGANGHWLRARITDAGGQERLLDFSRSVDWQGWRHLTASIPADIKKPVKLTDIYLVESESGTQDKGVIYFDQLSVLTVPAAPDTAVQTPPELSSDKEINPGTVTSMTLGDDLELTFNHPAQGSRYTVSARQVRQIELPTPGYYPVMPLFNITAQADGDTADKLPAAMKIRINVKGLREPARARLLYWDAAAKAWQPVPAVLAADSSVLTGKTDRLGLLGLMEDDRPVPVFTDTAASWAAEMISQMAARGIVNGYPDGTFLPKKGVTRAEFISLLAATLGWTPEKTPAEFKDTIPAWAQGNIASAVGRGIVKGYPDGTFRPKQVITRAEMAVMLAKALNLNKSSQPSNYRDAKDIPAWAVQAIRDTKSADVMQGSSGYFRPRAVANRAEAAAAMGKVLEYFIQS